MKIDGFCYITHNLEEFYLMNILNLPNKNGQDNHEEELLNDLENSNKLYVYDRETKKFYVNCIETSVDGLNLIPRCKEKFLPELTKAIINSGGIPLETEINYLHTKFWFKHVKPKYRELAYVKYQDFMYLYEEYKDIMGNQIYLKHMKTGNIYKINSYGKTGPRKKPFIYKGNIIEHYFYTEPNTNFISGDDFVLISKQFIPVKSFEYELNQVEYSIFVIDGKVFATGIVGLKEIVELSDELKNIINDWVQKINLSNIFGKNYTFKLVDMLIDGARVIDLVEVGSVATTNIEVSHNFENNLKKFNKVHEKRLTFK